MTVVFWQAVVACLEVKCGFAEIDGSVVVVDFAMCEK